MKKINLKINLLFIFMVLLCLPAKALAGNATYSYDTYDRIERVAYENGPVVEFVYDGAGNLASKRVVDTVLHVSVSGSGGTVTASGGTDCGVGCYFFDTPSMVTLTALPDTGYEIVGWSEASCGSNITCDVTVDAMKHVTVTFALKTFTITPLANNNGMISPDMVQTVNYGTDMTFIMMPEEGYVLGDVLINGASVGAINPYTFTNVTTDYSIQPSFVTDPVIITPSNHDFGTIECGVTSTATTFLLANTGVTNRTVDTVYLSGKAAEEYSIVADSCSGLTLANSETCTVNVTFSPNFKWPLRKTDLVIDFADVGTSVERAVLRGRGGSTCERVDMKVLSPIINILMDDENENRRRRSNNLSIIINLLL